MTQETPSNPEGRVVPFRRRGSLFGRSTPRPPPALPDLEKYEHEADEPDDFRHRMLMNALGLGVTVFLIAGGLWIADVMAHMRKDQDCVLTGRAGCTPVDAPVRQR